LNLKYYDDDSSFGSEIGPPHLDPYPEELLDQCVKFNKGELCDDDSISHMSIEDNIDSSDMSVDGICVNTAPIDYIHKTEDLNNRPDAVSWNGSQSNDMQMWG
jgi:hypothetical protein